MASVAERRRFDGGELVHLIKCAEGKLDWQRILDRLGEYRELLLWHLILFDFVYPGHSSYLPRDVMVQLFEEARQRWSGRLKKRKAFRGTLLDPFLFTVDVKDWGYEDQRDLGPVVSEGGGFGELTIQPFGERALKSFIKTSIDETLRLENALAKLDCPHKVAITHYSPIKATLEGEPPQLYPFLGSSRLANALDRRGVDVIVHGHAHHGSPFGLTPGETPMHNVCRFVQSRHNGKDYCLFDI